MSLDTVIKVTNKSGKTVYLGGRHCHYDNTLFPTLKTIIDLGSITEYKYNKYLKNHCSFYILSNKQVEEVIKNDYFMEEVNFQNQTVSFENFDVYNSKEEFEKNEFPLVSSSDKLFTQYDEDELEEVIMANNEDIDLSLLEKKEFTIEEFNRYFDQVYPYLNDYCEATLSINGKFIQFNKG